MSVYFSRQTVSKRQNSDGHIVLYIRWQFARSAASHEADETKGSKTAIRGSYCKELVKVCCSPGVLR